MTTELRKRLAPFSRLSDTALLGTNGYFYVFGEGVSSCLFIDGQITTKLKKDMLIQIGSGEKGADAKSDVLKLLIRKAATVLSLKYDFTITGLVLSASKWGILNNRIKDLNATHIQFEGDGEEIRVYAFDIRAIVGSSAMRQSYISGANGLYLKRSGHKFEFTALADAWLRLPVDSVSIDISTCGVLRMEYSDNGIRVNIRDQDIRRPHTAFYSKRIKRRVLFLFHPKGNRQVTQVDNSDDTELV